MQFLVGAAEAKAKQKAKHKAKAKPKIAKRMIQSTITRKNLPIITSDIYLLEKVISPAGAENKIKDQKKVGRFITFSNFSSLSGYDGCHWFQQDYKFAKTQVSLAKKKMMVGGCDKAKKLEMLPPSPFIIQYAEGDERLTLTSQKSKHKYIYRKNVATSK